MDKMQSAGMTGFDFSGGEPTLHPRFIDFLNYGKLLGCDVSCVSNGQRFSELEFVKKCTALSDVLISLHGTEHHDEITQAKGSFFKALLAIKNLSSINIKVRINFTICDQNRSDLSEFIQLVNDLNVSQVNFIFLNYNDDASDFSAINLRKNADELNNCLGKLKVPFNIRYVPFCLISPEYRENVVNYYDHIFDLTDWAPLYSYYGCTEKLSDEEIVWRTVEMYDKTLPMKYTKPASCLRCEYFSRCDGFKNQDRFSIHHPT